MLLKLVKPFTSDVAGMKVEFRNQFRQWSQGGRWKISIVSLGFESFDVRCFHGLMRFVWKGSRGVYKVTIVGAKEEWDQYLLNKLSVIMKKYRHKLADPRGDEPFEGDLEALRKLASTRFDDRLTSEGEDNKLKIETIRDREEVEEEVFETEKIVKINYRSVDEEIKTAGSGSIINYLYLRADSNTCEKAFWFDLGWHFKIKEKIVIESGHDYCVLIGLKASLLFSKRKERKIQVKIAGNDQMFLKAALESLHDFAKNLGYCLVDFDDYVKIEARGD